MNPAFFTSTARVQIWAFINGGREAVEGQPAYVPALPSLRFYYRTASVGLVGERHYLIESITGLALEAADSRTSLQLLVAKTVKQRELAGTMRAINKAVQQEAKALYASTCKKPRRKAVRK